MTTILILNIASLLLAFTAFSGLLLRRAHRARRAYRVVPLGRTAPRR